jgi:hypothetical protein
MFRLARALVCLRTKSVLSKSRVRSEALNYD